MGLLGHVQAISGTNLRMSEKLRETEPLYSSSCNCESAEQSASFREKLEKNGNTSRITGKLQENGTKCVRVLRAHTHRVEPLKSSCIFLVLFCIIMCMVVRFVCFCSNL
jgi:hypothetical protein